MMIKITTPSRLHITLIDLNAEIGRVDGGIGLTIDNPCFQITAETADKILVTGDSQSSDRIRNAARSLLPEGCGISIRIEHDIPPHVGLGSGTQAALAADMAVNWLYDLGISVRDIASKVGRGGTSCIGVASFETGYTQGSQLPESKSYAAGSELVIHGEGRPEDSGFPAKVYTADKASLKEFHPDLSWSHYRALMKGRNQKRSGTKTENAISRVQSGAVQDSDKSGGHLRK
ncbi:MAG: beta-ribofuranosylaminobenzene 5'-phosphate synthase family protein [Euryarchaeota archaeon]|nr:beta-ribofuranosylaminobenzene 5'-phosphate synthase family protein [Euryarchaeota archaeon]